MNLDLLKPRLAIALLFVTCMLNAQSLKQVLFSTGGTFFAAGNKVKLYSYDPNSNQVSIIDSIYGDFSNELVTDSVFAYLHVGRATGSAAGEDMIIKYDLNTHQRVDSITNIPGVQKFIVTPSHLVVPFGYGVSNDYVRFYNKSTLDLVYSDNTIADMTLAATCLNDSVYVAFNRNDTGAVAVYSLNPLTRQRIAWFDTLSAGINCITNDGSSIYLLGEKFNLINYTVDYGAVTRYTPSTNMRQSTVSSEAHGMIGIRQDTIIAEFGTTNSYRASTLAPLSFNIQRVFSEGVQDIYSSNFFLQETDYFSYGQFVVLDRNGSTVLSTIPTDISGTAIALDYFGSPVSTLKNSRNEFTVYPNPATDHLRISKPNATYTIVSTSGQKVSSGVLHESDVLSIESLSPGIYIINLTGSNFHEICRFVKQ